MKNTSKNSNRGSKQFSVAKAAKEQAKISFLLKKEDDLTENTLVYRLVFFVVIVVACSYGTYYLSNIVICLNVSASDVVVVVIVFCASVDVQLVLLCACVCARLFFSRSRLLVSIAIGVFIQFFFPHSFHSPCVYVWLPRAQLKTDITYIYV